MYRKYARILIPAISIFILWIVGSRINPAALPGPIEVVQLSIEFSLEGGPPPYDRSAISELGTSLYRVIMASLLALLISVVLGILMGLDSRIESIISNWLPLWLTIPDIVVILVVMIILGFTGTSVITAVIITVTPFGIVNMWEGIQDLDQNLIEMASSFEAGSYLRWRYIFFPHLFSYMFASFRYIFGMVWKIVVIAEAFGVDRGIGAVFRLWYNVARIENVLAYFILFIAVMMFIEYSILAKIEERVFAWN